MSSTTVLIVDDHLVLTEALSVRLESESDLRVVGTAGSAERARELIAGHLPDVVVLDVELGSANGIDLLRELRTERTKPAVVMLTCREDLQTTAEAMRLGAAGFVLKFGPVQDLVDAIRWAARGEVWVSPPLLAGLLASAGTGPASNEAQILLSRLTPRELEVLRLMVEGLGYAGIAEELNLSVHTVRTHAHNLQAKLEVHSNMAAVATALEAGLRPIRGRR